VQADRDALETELSGRLQEACDSATQWKEAAERVAAEKAEAEAAHAQAVAALAELQASSSAQLVSIVRDGRPSLVQWVPQGAAHAFSSIILRDGATRCVAW